MLEPLAKPDCLRLKLWTTSWRRLKIICRSELLPTKTTILIVMRLGEVVPLSTKG